MLIKEAVYKEVPTTRRLCVEEAVYGCDHCGEMIEEYPENRLEITVFHREKEVEYLHLCSWECVLAHLAEIETDYLVSLPYMYFDGPKNDKKSGQHLITILKNEHL